MSRLWSEDEPWLTLLQDALARESDVPRSVIEAAYAAYSWRTIDGELAALTYDSTTEDPALAGARSQQAPLRALTFASSTVTIELEIAPTVLLGQLVPPQSGQIVVSLQDGSSSVVEADDVGAFTVEPIPSVPFRLQLTGPTTVATDWIRL